MKKKKTDTKQDAWTHYWTSPASESSGCIPGAPAAVADLLREIWIDFFTTLPQGGELVDLGTGGGAVLKEAHLIRPDLRLTGVDYAQALPELAKNICMLPGVSLERLPFADKRVDVITSQFAIEYAPLLQAVKEVHRVLRKDGVFLFICHHADSIIVDENVKRLGVIRDILAGSGLLQTVIAVVKWNKVLDPKKQDLLARILQKLQMKHPDQPMVNEVAEITAQLMIATNRLKKLLALKRDIEMEGRRISALKKSALNSRQIEELIAQFALHHSIVQLRTIYVPGTKIPLAWYIKSECNRKNRFVR